MYIQKIQNMYFTNAGIIYNHFKVLIFMLSESKAL